MTGFAFALWVALLAFWLLVSVGTLASVWTGGIFAPPPAPTPAAGVR